MQRFTELKVWQHGHALVLAIYRMSVGFPVAERYGLFSQLRRAALSVPTNIAEGSKRTGRNDYARFLNIAEASLAETEYLLMVSRDLGYITVPQSSVVLKEVAELARMLHGLREKVELSQSTQPPC
jgi:four helix bundle protein